MACLLSLALALARGLSLKKLFTIKKHPAIIRGVPKLEILVEIAFWLCILKVATIVPKKAMLNPK
jgi:hypothetical protein